jgi:Coenzyme F420-dependent N5,N10-methylene tetrahydromethanopterin reductase and related flavin-dependent oxidoreductases
VDEISGGRLTLGIGAGWNRAEFDAFGLPFDHRAARFAEGFDVLRGLLAGERVTTSGRFHRAQDAVLLPPPARRIPLMVGSSGERVLAATLPHVSGWNTWYDWFGNAPGGFAARNAWIDERCRAAGRDPGEVSRSACLLVAVGGGSGERPTDSGAPAVPDADLRETLAAMGEAGADEVILVADPIDEASIRRLGDRTR